MTKDEAVALAIEAKKNWGGGSSEFWLVNALEAIGVVKFDEPKTIDDRIEEMYRGYVSITPSYLRSRLKELGLKIVDDVLPAVSNIWEPRQWVTP